MNEQRSTATLSTIIAVLAVLGVLSVLTGLYLGVLLLLGALVLAYSERAPLARGRPTHLVARVVLPGPLSARSGVPLGRRASANR